MSETDAAAAIEPFENASEMRLENAELVRTLDRRLGRDSRPESECAALREMELQVRRFLDRGAATGIFIEDIKERTACQILLDYWSSTLAHAGVSVARQRLAAFDAARLPDLKDRPCPFVGLEAFRDRAFFFGRERAIDSLLERLESVPLVVVQGASGSGKSSLVIGGVLPALSAPDRTPSYRIVGPLTPGNAPLESLVAAAAASTGKSSDVPAATAALRGDSTRIDELLDSDRAGATLLVVDQFEELFTLCSEEDRKAFVAILDARLRTHPNDRVILTLREEFSSELDELEPLRPYLARHARFSMKEWSMGYDDLRAAIERPAALVNLQFAPGIVDHMVKSVLGLDTALPLLQFALRSLWKQRDRNRITREVYASIGGSPLAALESSAESFYGALMVEQQQEVERILLELVRIDRMLEPYRWPRLRSSMLATGNPRTEPVLALLEKADFIRATPTVRNGDFAIEVKHEALLRNWPRYIVWIAGKRERVRQRLALAEAARLWHAAGRSSTEGLLSGWQLQEVHALTDLSPIEQAYVRASSEAADRANVAREAAVRRQVRLRWMFGSALGAMALLVVVAWIVGQQRERQSVLSDMLDVQMQVTRARDALTRDHLDTGLAGVLQVVQRTRGPELRTQTRELLLSSLQHVAGLERLFVGADGGSFQAVAFHPARQDGLLAFAGADGKVYVAGLDAPEAQALAACSNSPATALSFDPAGRFLAAGCGDGTLSIWLTDGWRRRGPQNTRLLDEGIWAISASADGRTIAAGGKENKVVLLSLAADGASAPDAVTTAEGAKPAGHVWSLAFSSAGGTLLVGDGIGRVLSCAEPVSGHWRCEEVSAYAHVDKDTIRALAFSPDDQQIAVGRWLGGVEVWDAKFSAASRLSVAVGESPTPIHSLAFFEACGRRQLAIGKGSALLYRSLSAAGAELSSACSVPERAPVGDETFGLAAHGPTRRLAAATHGGYVGVFSFDGLIDPTRRELPISRGSTRPPLRGAAVATDATATWLAVPTGRPAADGTNLTLQRVSADAGDDADATVRLAAGADVIARIAGSPTTRTFATLTCRPAAAADCTDADPHEVAVWGLADDLRSVQLRGSWTAPDFQDALPERIALNHDATWLVISFADTNRMLQVRPGTSADPRWLQADLQEVNEIAFSHDGRMFAAGGPALQRQHDAADGVQVWNVQEPGFRAARHARFALSPSANKVYDVGFVADANGELVLLAAGEAGAVDRWWLSTGRMLDSLRLDSVPVYLLAFSPRESLVAAADRQGIVRLWDTSRWVPLELRTSARGFERPGFLAFSEDGTWLASGANTVQTWDLDTDSLERKLCMLLREPGQHGAASAAPLWQRDGACAAR